MTQNIHIRFVGSADLAQVHREIGMVTKDIAGLSAAIQSGATAGGMKNIADVRWLDNFKKSMAAQRSLLHSSVMALDDFGVRSVKVADHVDTLTEKIRAQKFGISDLVREHKNLRDVYRQQLANRQAMTMTWSRNGDGSVNADVITRNRSAAEFNSNVKNWRSELGMYNQVLASVADNTVKWGKNTQWAGRQLTAGLSMPLIAAAAGTAALAYEIDKGLTSIVKVYGDASTALTTSDRQIKEASMETVRNMASAYGQSAKDTLEITAQLAATGRTGVELQQSTAQVTRARLLGELDLQDAMKATTTLQSVYNMNSRELGDTFNYMNSMENQTVLTMQDFVVGIPKVSGVIKELGGDVRTTGNLLAAMKIAGIDAAEGANAIKSIAFKTAAPSSGAKTLLKQATGQTYEEIVGDTNDVTTRLIRLGEAMKGLDEDKRVGIIAKMFGLYQGSKALSIISQLTDGSEQMSRALEVSAQSTEEWGATAERELEKLTGSNWNKLQQQWQSLKVSLAEVGDTFLEMAVPILSTIEGLVAKFNGLDDGTKKWIARLATLAAAFGPIVMFAGLMGNMIGSIGKLSSFLVNIIAPFKMLTAEEKAAADISRLKRKTTNDEAKAYGILADQIRIATAELSRLTALEHQRLGIALPVGGATTSASGILGPNGKPLASSASTASVVSAQAEKTKSSWGKIAGHASTFAIVGAAGAASMMTDSGSTLNNVANAAFILATMGPMLGRMPWRKMGNGISDAMRPLTQWFDATPRVGVRGPGLGAKIAQMGNTAKSSIGKMVAGFGSMLPVIGTVAAAVGSIGVAVGATWYILHKNIEQSRKEMEAYGNSAMAYADTIGFTYREVGSQIDAAGNVVTTLDQKVDKFIEKNKDVATVLSQFAGMNDEDKLQRAIGEGLKAAMHGATKEQAEEAAMIAWRTIGTRLSEKEMVARIRAEIDFGNTEQVTKKKINDIQWQVQQALKNGFKEGNTESIWRWFSEGNNGLDTQSQQSIKNATKQALELINAAADDEKPALQKTLVEALTSGDQDLFAQMMKTHSAEFSKAGIKSADDIRKTLINNQKAIASGFGAKNPLTGQGGASMLSPIGISKEEQEQLNRNAEANAIALKFLKDNTRGLTEEQKNSVTTFDEYLKAIGKSSTATMTEVAAKQKWIDWQARMTASGAKWSEQEKLTRLNILRLAAGLDAAKTSAQGFGPEIEDSASSLTSLYSALNRVVPLVGKTNTGFALDLEYTDPTQALSAVKDTYAGAMNTIYEASARASDQIIQRTMDGIAIHYDGLRDGIDRQQKAAQDSFDKQSKKFDYAWESRMEAFAKRWDKRRDATEAKYDSQIDKIKAQIKAEEDAEKIRERIFAAEQTRLSRLANLQNRNIDLNAAINSGNVDEAAKISNDAAATTNGWALEDAAAAGSTVSEARKAALEGKIDSLDKAKDAALERMDEQERAEQKMLERQKDREKELLDARRKASEESFAARKKALDKEEAAAKKSKEEQVAIRRLQLDAELEVLKAFVPRDQAELDAHIKKIQGAYNRFGTVLGGKGTQWSKTVGNALTRQMEVTRAKEANTAAWDALGRVIAENMTKGAFNMTLSQFIRWISTGEMPSNAGVGYKGKNARKVNNRWVYGTQGGVPSGAHSGAIIGKNDNSRTGYTGSLSPSERLTTTLVGEAILNRRATRNLGEDFIEDLNRWGGLPKAGTGIGGPTDTDMTVGSVLGTAPLTVGFRSAVGFIADRKKKILDAMASGAGSNAYPIDNGAIYPGGWRRPTGGPVTSRYGMRFHPTLNRWKLHGGTDLGVPVGTPVHAARGGQVTFAGPMGSYGNHVVVSHGGGLATTYSHLSEFTKKAGASVRTGDVIARSGNTGRSTGPHLHFEYMKNGERLNPNMIIPGLDSGGFILKDGLARLHEGERVLTKPNTKDLDDGLEKMASGGDTYVENHYTFTGPINGIDDLERAIIKANENIENRRGTKKKVGAR